MSRAFRIVTAIAATLSIACGERPRGDAEVIIALPSATLLSTTTYVAEDLNLFALEGLEVTVRTIVGVGSVVTVQAI